MKYYQIDSVECIDYDIWCFTNEPLKSHQGYDFNAFRKGYSLGDLQPEFKMQLFADDDYSGTSLGTFIGNSDSLIIANTDVVTKIKEYSESVEYHTLNLMKKRKIISEEYSIINPLLKVDCVSRSASNLKLKNGKLSVIYEMRLDADSLKDAPPIFRVEGMENCYIINEELKTAIESIGETSLELKEIPQFSETQSSIVEVFDYTGEEKVTEFEVERGYPDFTKYNFEANSYIFHIRQGEHSFTQKFGIHDDGSFVKYMPY